MLFLSVCTSNISITSLIVDNTGWIVYPKDPKSLADAVIKAADEKKLDNDKIYTDNSVRILVDKKSLLYLIGTTLEYSGGLNGKGFVFNNPNANRTCGCGESFSL